MPGLTTSIRPFPSTRRRIPMTPPMTRVARLLPSQAKRARGRAWLVLGLCILGQSANAADLLAVYQRALQNDPQLREAEANRLAALEAKPQAVAALLPQLNGSAQIAKEHDEGYDNQAFTESFPQPNGTLQTGVFQTPFNGTTSTTNRVYRLDLKQNLFNWTNWVALKTADSQVAQAEADYQAAQQDLIERVSERYFNVLSAQDDLEAQQAALVSINRQLDQAESRYQIGLIAITDVEEVRASHDSTVAAVIDAKRTLASNQELLREITGEGFDFLARPIEPFNLPSPDPLASYDNLSFRKCPLSIAYLAPIGTIQTHPCPAPLLYCPQQLRRPIRGPLPY